MAVERVPLDAREPGDVAQRRARRALRAVELDRRLDDPPPRLLLLLGASLQLFQAARAHERLRQIKRESASLIERAHEPNLAAEQVGELAADSQAQARAAETAAGARIRLLESLEN